MIVEDLPLNLYTNAQIRQLEKITAEEFGITPAMLMERAAIAAYQAILERWSNAKNVLVMCGTGNNGGDGYALATLLHEKHFHVAVFYAGSPEKLKGEALQAFETCRACGVFIKPIAECILARVDLVIDALLGAGLKGQVSQAYQDAIVMINSSHIPVLALDVPSGVDVDTGAVQGAAIKAATTITFIGLKPGLLTGDAPEFIGKLMVNDLQIPRQAFEKILPAGERISLFQFRPILLPRERTAHKGQFGHVLIIGGDYGYAGACRMAGEAALRVGAGLVSVATRPGHVAAIVSARPELMCRGVEGAKDLEPLLDHANVIAIGPGLSNSEWGQQLLDRVLTMLPSVHVVLDADALNLLAANPRSSPCWILTPHPGEAARLLGITTQQVQQDRLAAAKSLQAKYGGVIVLKGSGTIVVSDQGGGVAICSYGNPGMASGGMGDILTGLIAGLVAQGINTYDAAGLGVSIHAKAGDVEANNGERGMLASDLLPHIKRLVNPR